MSADVVNAPENAAGTPSKDTQEDANNANTAHSKDKVKSGNKAQDDAGSITNTRKPSRPSHEDEVAAMRRENARKEKHKKRLKVIMGSTLTIAMLLPLTAGVGAALLNMQSGVPVNANSQIAASESNMTSSSSTSGNTDVTKMTPDERRQIIKKEPSFITDKKEQEEFIKNGTIPESVLNKNDAAKKNNTVSNEGMNDNSTGSSNAADKERK